MDREAWWATIHGVTSQALCCLVTKQHAIPKGRISDSFNMKIEVL